MSFVYRRLQTFHFIKRTYNSIISGGGIVSDSLHTRVLHWSEGNYCGRLEFLMTEISIDVSSKLLPSVVYKSPHVCAISLIF